MDIGETLERAMIAIEQAVESEETARGEVARFNVDRFISLLLDDGVELFTVGTRTALLTELEAVRAERSTQRVKLEKTGLVDHRLMVDALDRREFEIVSTLWPPRKEI